MTSWFWIVLLLVVLAGGASIQVSRMAQRMRHPHRQSLRARRAERWRRRAQARGGGSAPQGDHERKNDD